MLITVRVTATLNKMKTRLHILDIKNLGSSLTWCSHYREKEHADLVNEPMSVISESSKHSRIAAFICITIIIS